MGLRIAPGCGYMRLKNSNGAQTSYAGFMLELGQPKFDLAALISECDANYIRLRQLFPDLESRKDWRFVLPIGDQEYSVRCQVQQRSKYTCLLRIAQDSFFAESEVCEFGASDLLVRIYLDTNSAEVVEMQRQRAFRPWTEPQKRSGQAAFEKLYVNRFLGEYLTFCARHGAVSKESLRVD